ncbi:MAG: Rieske (2Fe-2S) protein [Bacteroidales bacterium]
MAELVLCSLSDLDATGAKGPIRCGADSVFVVRHGGEVRAWLNSCPHAFAPLEMEPDRYFDLSGTYVLCTMHGAHFEPDSGLCVMGPCKGRKLTPYPIGIHNGKVIAAPLP